MGKKAVSRGFSWRRLIFPAIAVGAYIFIQVYKPMTKLGLSQEEKVLNIVAGGVCFGFAMMTSRFLRMVLLGSGVAFVATGVYQWYLGGAS